MKVNKRVPVRFEKVEDYDTRFQKVKIWLMHLGKNYNKSIFDLEPVLEAMNSLKNTPILGYVENEDFRGHESELVVEDGEIKVNYIGHAYGVISESCNPRFEQKIGVNGEVLDYLVVDGLLWTKLDDAVSILNESGEVGQSMELHDEYDGYWDDEGYFHFTKFSFYGACMLGKDVLPAMQLASVEQVFSTSVIQSEIDSKLREFNQMLSQKHFKEVDNNMTLEQLLAKYSITNEQLVDKGIVAEDFSIEDLETKIQETFTETEEVVEPEVVEPEQQEETIVTEMESTEEVEPEVEVVAEVVEPEVEVTENYTRTFELSHEDIRWKMYEQIDTHMESKGFAGWYYISSVFESHIIVEEDDSKFYKVDYSKDGENITLGEATEVFGMFLTGEEKGALELMRSSFESIKQENEQLKSFQAGVLESQHEAEVEELFSNFSKLTEDDLKDIRENVHNFSIEQIETKCFELLGRKTANFSRKDTTTSIKVNFNNTGVEGKNGVDHIFAKHGIKK